MGTFILTSSIAIDALKASILGFFGGFGIVAGLLLIALGGALKAFAGGPSATSGGAASATSGGGAVGGGLEAGTGQDNLIAQNDQEDKRTVTVNIQGQVLNTRETGLELAEIVRSAVETDGAKIESNVAGVV